MNVVVAGAGKIGSLIACMLADCGDYHVHMMDITFQGSDVHRLQEAMPSICTISLDVKDEQLLTAYFQNNAIDAVISGLPFYLNSHVAIAAKAAKVHYFDLTEDVSVTSTVKAIADKQPISFVPQCGLAPGFVSIVANSLIREFDEAIEARLRVGALPQRASNGLHYSLIWSTDGLINEYGNLCDAIEHGKLVQRLPLEEEETLEIDGAIYEAFNTSGGLGSLSHLFLGKIQTLNYKTIRYPGHRDKMFFLMNDLKLNEDRETLKRILEKAVPRTYQDVVIMYVSVQGHLEGEYREKSYLKKIYPMMLRGLEWSAIQVSTAAGVCAVVDLVLEDPKKYRGFVLQEQFNLKQVLMNRFGQYFA
ncbi:MAG: saccharopine dehydrogenase NADP-binding domain-containing protein [Gammaproteobacteria bacterium]|nr:saccharopine dehydrogenase NADP-binding domain-containing protein [Gammaproteobacteria bacterium]